MSSGIISITELLKKGKTLADCPPLGEPKYKKNLEKLQELMAPLEGSTETGIILDTEKCDGCGICVIACPVNSRFSQECLSGKAPRVPVPKDTIYQLVEGRCKIISIEQCRRYVPPKTNCRICEIYCPRYAIEIKV